MKKKILLPTDFSICAWNAISYAIELFKDETCDFYLFNTFIAGKYVRDRYAIPESGDPHYEASKIKSEEDLMKAISEIKAVFGENSKHTFKYKSQMNFVLEGVQNMVEKLDIDMVIIGTKGISNAFEVIYGTNAVDIMESVRRCPVLAVPDEASPKLPSRIVFPTDFIIPIQKREMSYLTNVAKKADGLVSFLHVTKAENALDANQKNNKQLIEEYFEGLNYEFVTIDSNSLHDTLNDFIEEKKIDLIAFINQKHHFMGSILSRPLVKKLGYNSEIPVMALHD